MFNAPYNFDVDEAEADTQMEPIEVHCDPVLRKIKI
jgi:hypothetical protein